MKNWDQLVPVVLIACLGSGAVSMCESKDENVIRPMKFYRTRNEMNPLYPISIIYVDAQTEEALGKFPINRKYYAQLIEQLETASPKYIVLKYFFTDPREGDTALIQTLTKYKNILTQAGALNSSEAYPTEGLQDYLITENRFQFPNYSSAWIPHSQLAMHFSGIGFVNVLVTNGEFMEFQLVVSLNHQLYPSLPLLILEKEGGERLQISKDMVSTQRFQIPINPHGSFFIELSEPNKLYPTFSFIEVLQGRVSLDQLKNNIIIVFYNGGQVRGVSSSYAIPHNPAEIVADAINTILKYFHRSSIEDRR